MTYAPNDLLAIRSWLISTLDLAPGTARGVDLEAAEVGIVGDPAHAASGGYHEGDDDLDRVDLLNGDYSKSESPRDQPGSNAASAIDIGDFDATVGGRRTTLRSLSAGIVAACQAKDPRTRDIREVIYTPDGVTVRRWDRMGRRSGGDNSHLWHTHVSFHRDSEGRRTGDDNFLGLVKDIITGEGGWLMALSDQEQRDLLAMVKALHLGTFPAPTDTAGKPDGRGNTIRLADMQKYLLAGVGAYDKGPADPAGPAGGFYLDKLLKLIRDEVHTARVAAENAAAAATRVMTADQIAALGAQISAAVVAAHQRLSEADEPVIRDAVMSGVRAVLADAAQP